MGLLKNKHVYSYSQLSSFDECPYSYYLERIEKTDNIASNAYAERGILIHDILDRWAKKLITKEEMIPEYESRYPEEVVTAFPSFMKGAAAKAYQSGIDFFEAFDEFKGYKVISAEEKFTIDLPLSDGTTRPFAGVVDLILRKDWTDELVICDHKSKSLDSFKKAEKEMWKQQYLYSSYVFEKYGEWPTTLMFHLFGDLSSKHEKPFDLKEYRETIDWATNRIHKMENNTVLDWLRWKDSSDFFCQQICSVRWNCPKSVEKPLTKMEKEALKARQEEEAEKYLSEETEPESSENLTENTEFEKSIDIEKEETQEENKTEVLKCENCGEPYVPGKRKCPYCKAWYKTRTKA